MVYRIISDTKVRLSSCCASAPVGCVALWSSKSRCTLLAYFRLVEVDEHRGVNTLPEWPSATGLICHDVVGTE